MPSEELLLNQLDHALLIASLLVYHFSIVWFSHLRAYVFAESAGHARPPALPWFVWVGAITSFLVVYGAIVFSTRQTGVDTSWFFLVAIALSLVLSVDLLFLMRRSARQSRAGRAAR